MCIHKQVQVGKDQEKAQSERDSYSKNTMCAYMFICTWHLYYGPVIRIPGIAGAKWD